MKLPPGFQKLVSILMLSLASFPLNVSAGKSNLPVPEKQTGPAYAPGEVIVQFEAAGAVNSEEILQLNQENQISEIKPVFDPALVSEKNIAKAREKFPERNLPQNTPAPDLKSFYLIKYSSRETPGEFCKKYTHSKIKSCRPNDRMKVNWIPNDPYFHSRWSWGQYYFDLWALLEEKLNMPAAWDVTRGNGITVAVVDTGLDMDHEDIQGNVWNNAGEIPDNGIDDDQNGLIDDIRGWNFVANNNRPKDDNGHGTHVSGIIAARGSNHIGIIGVAPEAKIMALKAFDEIGGASVTDIANALYYAAVMGARVINNSWSCLGRCPSIPVIEGIVAFAHSLGVVLVFAAGNDPDNVTFYSPQNMVYPKPVVVGSVNEIDTPTRFSRSGALIDVAGPGSGQKGYDSKKNILSLKSSATHGIFFNDPSFLVGENYLREGGTSMATAHVSGLAALILANRPSFTPDQVRHVLRLSADPVPGFEFSTGAGRINAARALAVPSVPSLRAEILAPVSDSIISLPCAFPLVITGNASGNDFSHYQIFYRSRSVAEPWIPLGDPVTTPVEYGILAVSDLCPPTGTYLLKLAVTASSGQQFHVFSQIIFERPVRPIAAEIHEQMNPSIDSTRIVWEDMRHEGENSEIYLYDLATGAERRITNSFYGDEYPAISGNRIVYTRRDDSIQSPAAVFLFDLSTGTERRITNAPQSRALQPDIDGNRIVYVREEGNSGFQVYLFDLAANTETRITHNSPRFNSPPRISGDKIVWSDGETRQVHLFDIAAGKERQITSAAGPWFPNIPDISGDKIVYDKGITFSDSDIFLYDLATMTERRLTTDPRKQVLPRIDGRRIVWQDYRDCGYIGHDLGSDVYAFDLNTNTEARITARPHYQLNAAISGSRIVWMDGPHASDPSIGPDIYLRDLAE